MYTVYILYSESQDTFYKGQTRELSARIKRHNHRQEKATKSGVPWKVVWSTNKSSRSEALALEKKLKNLSRDKTIEFMNKYSKGVVGPDAPDSLWVRRSGC
jgi:putative endonuclease